MSFARLLSATISPSKATHTRRGESSKYSVCGLSAPVSKLNMPALWLPKGPVPMVRVIVSLLSGRSAPASLPSLAPSCAGSVYWSIRAPDASSEDILSKARWSLGASGPFCAGDDVRRDHNLIGERKRDASGDRHGRGQRRADLLRGCGRRGPAGPGTCGDRGQQDVGRPTHGLRLPLQGHPPRHAGLRDDRDGGGTVLPPRGPARSTRLSGRRAGAPRGLFDGGRSRARLRARVPAEGR